MILKKEVISIATTEAQKRATAKWRAKATKAYSFRLRFDRDADLIVFLDSKKSKQGAIKEALRDAMKKEKNNK